MIALRALAAVAVAGALIWGQAAADDAACAPLEITLTQTTPTRAQISWQARSAAVSYFVSYSTGKFPTQLDLAVPLDGLPLSVELKDLRPGRTYEVHVCEGLTEGACPGPSPQTCTTRVTVSAITAAPATVRPDETRAQCSIQPGVALTGESIGYPFEEPVEARSVEACCDLCAGTEPQLPYLKQCTAFVYYEESQSCGLLTGWTQSELREGRTSGLVTGWAAPGR